MNECDVLNAAVMESTAFGWRPIVAGYVSIYGIGGKIKDENVYAKEIVEYCNKLDFDEIIFERNISSDDLEFIRDFC